MGIDPDNSGLLGKTPVFFLKYGGPADVMPTVCCPGGAAGVGPGRFSWSGYGKRNTESSEWGWKYPRDISLRQWGLVRRCFYFWSARYCWPGPRFASKSLRWRFVPFIKAQRCQTVFQSGITLTLMASFKSITQKRHLLITFDSSDQSAAAKAVLDRTLAPWLHHCAQDNNSQGMRVAHPVTG